MNTGVAIKSIISPLVITASPDETIQHVKERLLKYGFHHIPVVAQGKVVGMISQSDIQLMEHHFTLFHTTEAERSNQQIFTTILAREIMATPVMQISGDEPISKAVDIFLANILHALPVINDKSQLIGIITPVDLLHFAFITNADRSNKIINT